MGLFLSYSDWTTRSVFYYSHTLDQQAFKFNNNY